MLEDQVLPELGLQSLLELDLLPKGLTEAAQTRGPLWLARPGGHFGRF